MSLHRHHRKRRSQGGTDDPVNILEVTPEIHDWIHGNPEQAYELGWLVKSHDEPAEVSVKLPNLLKVKKERKPRAKEKARDRENVQIRVPKDERENGAGILDDLLEQAKERLAPIMGWEDDVSSYFVLVAVLVDWINTTNQEEE